MVTYIILIMYCVVLTLIAIWQNRQIKKIREWRDAENSKVELVFKMSMRTNRSLHETRNIVLRNSDELRSLSTSLAKIHNKEIR